jgi:hypothetical protein
MLKIVEQSLKTPTKLCDLDIIGQKLISMDTNYDSIEYRDPIFRKRRLTIGEMAKWHKMGE